MGVVWRGVHRDTGVPVAVKVITRAALIDDRIRESFRNEVKAVAGLDHPGIVWVFDFGEVDLAAARASDGKLVAGGPYLAMEHASGGTLHGWTPPHWDAAREMILQVLDALGHAHARGVLHRDLKPPNVLRCAAGDVRPGWKLVDFGIATLLDQTVEESINQGIIGTLAYMSPEQIRATWRDYGPWTDLYALGCMLYRVVGGHRAFRETKGTALMIAQLNKKPIPLEPQIAVPQGLDEWMAKLLEKDPRDRFRSAADAALALSQLGGPVSTEALVPIEVREEDEIATAPMSPDEVPTARNVQQPQLPRGGKHDDAVLLPLSWRRSEAPRPPPRLIGAGLGLFDLRSIPLTGRHRERDQLWRSLRAVHKGARGRVVCLHGPSGVGKSRLGQWIGETGHELAGCRYLKATARVGEAPQNLLVRMLHRELHTPRLDHDERLSRVKHELDLPSSGDMALGRTLSSLLSPTGEAFGQRVEGAARHAVVRRTLEALAEDRPVVVVLDDVHLNADGLAFARHFAEAQAVRPSPVLIVLTWRDEAVAEDPDLLREVESLHDLDAVNLVPVTPLSDRDMARMVQELLPLERSLAAQVEERVAGNPLFAAQLVRDWVRDDLLVEGASGFELKQPGPITATVEDVWRKRVDRVLEGLPDDAQWLLELAAVLGLSVDEQEWQRVGDDPKGKYAAAGRVMFRPEHGAWRQELIDRLIAARLADATEEGFGFAQEMIREVLFAMAREAGRLGKNHRACARTLLHMDAERHAVRIGRHLVDGRYPTEAIPFLQQGVVMVRRQGGPRAALPVLALLERALREAGVPEADPTWVQLYVDRANIFNGLERLDDARHWADRAEQAAVTGKHRVLEARAVTEVGKVQMAERDAKVADRSFARAEALLRDVDPPDLHGEVNYCRSLCARLMQEPTRARAHALVAAQYLTRAQDQTGLARGWMVLGTSSLLDRELDEAERFLWRAVRLHERDGDTLGVAECWTSLGMVARLRGDDDEARTLLGKALVLYRQAGSPQVVHPQLELARVALVAKEWNEAWSTASEVLEWVGWQGHSARLVSTHAALATAAAGAGRWSDLDLHLERVREGLSRIEVLEPDLAWALELAGDLAASGSRSSPARKAWKLALGLQNTVDPARAKITERKLASAR